LAIEERENREFAERKQDKAQYPGAGQRFDQCSHGNTSVDTENGELDDTKVVERNGWGVSL
jgi:hypothetical protein